MTRRAVVSGANSGIGLATALRLAADGYQVFAGSRGAAGLDDIARAATDAGATGIIPITLDVTDDASVEAAFAEAQADGPLAVLVNNAGVTGAGSVEHTPIETYAQMFDTNVAGVVRCLQQTLPGMREAGSGRIVNVSSASAIIGPPLMSSYALTKVALEGLSESLQCEVAPFGIRVIVLRPGTIMTPIWNKSAMPDDPAYQRANDFLMAVFTHNLTKSGVPAEAVAAVVSAAVADPNPAFRYLVGDADVLQRMRDGSSDTELFDTYALDDEAFRERYREQSGIDYWG